MSGSRVVRVGDMSDFLDVMVTLMRIADMPHWSLGLGDMMANMRALFMVSLWCFVMCGCSMVCLSGMGLRLLLSKHQVNWLLFVVHSNWLEDNFMLRG